MASTITTAYQSAHPFYAWQVWYDIAGYQMIKHYRSAIMRKLIKTFPGLPEDAGIYKLPDGSTSFFNCGPHTELTDPELLPDFEGFFEVSNPETGEIRFIHSDPFYRTLKNALLSAGTDINDIKTEDQLMHTLSNEGQGGHISHFIQQKWINRKPTTLQQSMARALIIDDWDLYWELKKILQRREASGLTRVK